MDDINLIKKHLREFEKQLYGFNYECHFTFDEVCEGTSLAVARKLINNQYKLSWQTEIDLKPIEFKAFLTDINEKLLYRGDNGAGVKLNEKQESHFKNQLTTFRVLLDRNFNNAGTTILVHPEICTWIFWGFCFLIVDNEKQRIFLFEGLSSD